MAETYDVTGIQYSTARNSDGSYTPVVEVSYTTKTTPPVSGTVQVDASIVKDKAKYAAAVASAIEAETSGHTAVLGL